jgi:hypothetical protein
MERAADVQDAPGAGSASGAHEPAPYVPPVGEKLAEPRDPLEHAMAHPLETPHASEVAGPQKPPTPNDPAPY